MVKQHLRVEYELGKITARDISCQLSSRDNVLAAGRARGNLGEGDERVVLATVETTSLRGACVASTSRRGGVIFCILSPGNTSGFQEIDDAARLLETVSID
jgi:hypothetical protein